MGRSTEVGPAPCECEGGCSSWDYCKAQGTDCHAFRCYVAGWPREGIDIEDLKKKPGYKFISDREVKVAKFKPPRKGEL
jgi:hypothetical protein